jgi:hypothetical protein
MVLVVLVLVVVCVVLAFAYRSTKRQRDALAYDVEMYCSSLATDLTFQAEQYAEGIDYLKRPGLTNGQRQQVEQVFFASMLTGDITMSGRTVAGAALWNRFYFCLETREGDEKTLDALGRRFERARDELDRSREDDHADIAHAVAEMAELAETVRRLPLRAHVRPPP